MIRAFLGGILATALLCIAFTGAAGAATWHFEGEALEGEETILGSGPKVVLTIPGITTICKGFLYIMRIENNGGAGVGEITYQPIFGCTTDTEGACAVESSESTGLPWAVGLATVGANRYVVIEGVEIDIAYSGAECPLDGIVVEIQGSAGGIFDNETEIITFNASSFEATETELEAFGNQVALSTFLSAEAFGPHLGEALTVS